jgi:hypothetical protein
MTLYVFLRKKHCYFTHDPDSSSMNRSGVAMRDLIQQSREKCKSAKRLEDLGMLQDAVDTTATAPENLPNAMLTYRIMQFLNVDTKFMQRCFTKQERRAANVAWVALMKALADIIHPVVVTKEK